MPKAYIHVSFDVDLLEQLDEKAKASYRTRTACLEMAVDEWLRPDRFDPPVLSDEAKRRLAAGAPRRRASAPRPDEIAGPVESEAKQVRSYPKDGGS